MNNLNIFNTLPKGYKLLESKDREKLADIIGRAFGDIYYPIPTLKIPNGNHVKLYKELGYRWIDNAVEKGLVLVDEECNGCLILTKMHDALDTAYVMNSDPVYNFLTKEEKDNTMFIFQYTYDDEKYLEFDPENDVYIEIFAVDPSKQGNKVGSNLMRTLFEECDKAKKDILLLTSIETNKRMYEHLGFKLIHENYKKEIDSHAYYLKRYHK